MRIVGLGTGRCGTHSLARLLSLQHGIEVGHERHPPLDWEGDAEPDRHIRRDNTADVGFYYLNYVEGLLRQYPDLKAVCMVRDRQSVVDSFIRVRPRGTDWFSHGGKPNQWDRCFPKYNVPFSLAVAAYWTDYNAKAMLLAGERFRLFRTEKLNSESAVDELLEWLGFNNRVVVAGIREV